MSVDQVRLQEFTRKFSVSTMQKHLHKTLQLSMKYRKKKQFEFSGDDCAFCMILKCPEIVTKFGKGEFQVVKWKVLETLRCVGFDGLIFVLIPSLRMWTFLMIKTPCKYFRL